MLSDYLAKKEKKEEMNEDEIKILEVLAKLDGREVIVEGVVKATSTRDKRHWIICGKPAIGRVRPIAPFYVCKDCLPSYKRELVYNELISLEEM